MTRKFVVIKAFTDLVDENHVYNSGDFYPREGVELDYERVDLLASTDNARKESVIVEVLVKEETDGVPGEFPVRTGGGYYELSNGDKIQGKDAAIEAEKALKE